ncbi:hypothetical protein [Pleionea sediminis]|uniref:hypothetical protein n=1 Tax=Pleionea sediminis TaxID=2569479 RepID=UPI0011855488|nr:hypothetical protein [Pleionea sediminis]
MYKKYSKGCSDYPGDQKITCKGIKYATIVLKNAKYDLNYTWRVLKDNPDPKPDEWICFEYGTNYFPNKSWETIKGYALSNKTVEGKEPKDNAPSERMDCPSVTQKP